ATRIARATGQREALSRHLAARRPAPAPRCVQRRTAHAVAGTGAALGPGRPRARHVDPRPRPDELESLSLEPGLAQRGAVVPGPAAPLRPPDSQRAVL